MPPRHALCVTPCAALTRGRGVTGSPERPAQRAAGQALWGSEGPGGGRRYRKSALQAEVGEGPSLQWEHRARSVEL